jgi:FkbM family methyltransferase
MKALWRSLRIYRLDRTHSQSLTNLYQPFVRSGRLAFDIGAHVGDRTNCFRRLGAHAVCVEPQKTFYWFLRLSNLLSARVTVLPNVVSNTGGIKTLHVNSRNPTVSTLSESFVEAASAAGPGWQGQKWDHALTVEAITLDQLIKTHGTPDFIKIDVEGAELDVLRGLSHTPLALSFEFTMIQRDLTIDCVRRCQELGLEQFNVSLGESHTLKFESWISAPSLLDFLSDLSDDANSGDIYARPNPS